MSSKSKLCLCFDKETNYIKYDLSKDSVQTSFSITNKGYETEAKRKKALEDYAKKGPIDYPVFVTNYISGKPKKMTSMNEANCVIVVSIEDFRQQNFEYPQGTGGSHVHLIEKISDNSFLKWDAVLMAIE